MIYNFRFYFLILCALLADFKMQGEESGLPLYYWQQKEFVNFGDYLSVKIVERILDKPVRIYKKGKIPEKKLLALGSMLYFANTGDVLWGTGSNHKFKDPKDYSFVNLDVRAVRGPLTRAFIRDHFGIFCPEVYGDPALLFPYLFPEFKKSKKPKIPYIVIPHLYERFLFPKENHPEVVYPTDPWDEVIKKILESEFVISGSLHGLIIAESYGIPARYLRLSEKEPLFKYEDYYLSTGRENFTFANSVEEALLLGGEPEIIFDPEPLYNAFPFDYWPLNSFKRPNFAKDFFE